MHDWPLCVVLVTLIICLTIVICACLRTVRHLHPNVVEYVEALGEFHPLHDKPIAAEPTATSVQ